MNRYAGIAEAVKFHLPDVVACGGMRAAAALKSGGRIIYMGAGTSGRLGVLMPFRMPPDVWRSVRSGQAG